MKIQVLHIDECPNWEEAGVHLRSALHAVGKPDTAIETILLTTPEQAERYAFAGSPTILIDGEDPFPTGATTTGATTTTTGTTTTDLACWVYNTGTRLAGSPTTEQLTQALRERL